MQDAHARLCRGVGGRLHEQPPPEALHAAEVLRRMKWTDGALCRRRRNARSVTATTVMSDNTSGFVGSGNADRRFQIKAAIGARFNPLIPACMAGRARRLRTLTRTRTETKECRDAEHG